MSTSTSSESKTGQYRHRRPPAYDHVRDPPSWSLYPREAASFLALLFAWAANVPEQTQSAKENAQMVVAAIESDVGGRHKLAAPAARKSATSVRSILQERVESCGDYGDRAPRLNSSVVGEGHRAFVIVCPADRVRTNIETYVKDRDTGRVAVQWCLASKDTGERRHCVQIYQVSIRVGREVFAASWLSPTRSVC